MAKVLYVKANPKEDSQSETFKVSEKFVSEYKELNPSDEVVILDLYKENIKFLDSDELGLMFSGKEGFSKKYAEDILTYDKIIIAAPMWNLSIPAILKAYIDYITYVGVTFNYTENGPVGAFTGKDTKLMHIVARGGVYSEEPMSSFESGDRYIRTIFGFLGISDIKTIAFENTSVLQGEELDNAREEIFKEVEKEVKVF